MKEIVLLQLYHKYDMRSLLAFCLIFCFFSCRKIEKEIEIEYYQNGRIKATIEKVDSLKEGVSTYYYPNGVIRIISNWEKDKLSGESVFFDSLGNIKARVNYREGLKNGKCEEYYLYNGFVRSTMSYKDDVLNGKFTMYFEEDSGKVNYEINYLNYKGSEKEFGSVFYDLNGNIEYEERRIDIEPLKDTLRLSELENVELVYKKPMFDSTIFIIGGFKEKFYDVDSSMFDTVKAQNHRIKLNEIKGNYLKKGWNSIRGVAKNYHLVRRDSLETVTSEVLPIFFEFEYYVE